VNKDEYIAGKMLHRVQCECTLGACRDLGMVIACH